MEHSRSQRADAQPTHVDSSRSVHDRGRDWPLAAAIFGGVLALYAAIAVGLFWLVTVTF
jgi:hypothetical protein